MSYVKVEKMDGGYTLEFYDDNSPASLIKKEIARNHDLAKRLLSLFGSSYSKKKINPSETIPSVKKTGLKKTKMGKK